VPVDLNIIVDPEPAFLPISVLVWFGRQRLEGRPVELLDLVAESYDG
jgi:hypothetical protein